MPPHVLPSRDVLLRADAADVFCVEDVLFWLVCLAVDILMPVCLSFLAILFCVAELRPACLPRRSSEARQQHYESRDYIDQLLPYFDTFRFHLSEASRT
ncbi:hypothetical protein E2C01_069520 [Portunus trituberculatus]|uniref:Uncharacterized protein n=1 Tax=Portunus trituberculatus TaxID=210409 RepID=A0A5B7HZ28_PORTR|nr:hypothetical protein [Portunus trituberculatus]